jgi:hypothetical protein
MKVLAFFLLLAVFGCANKSQKTISLDERIDQILLDEKFAPIWGEPFVMRLGDTVFVTAMTKPVQAKDSFCKVSVLDLALNSAGRFELKQPPNYSVQLRPGKCAGKSDESFGTLEGIASDDEIELAFNQILACARKECGAKTVNIEPRVRAYLARLETYNFLGLDVSQRGRVSGTFWVPELFPESLSVVVDLEANKPIRADIFVGVGVEPGN